MPRLRSAPSIAILVCCLATSALDAQTLSPAPRCTDSIPASQMHREVAYLEASRSADASPALTAQISNFVQSIVDHSQRLLGGDGSALPPVEPALGWYDVFGGIIVTAHRDGTFSAVPLPVGGDAKGEQFLLRALDAVRADGEPFLWPSEERGGSVSFLVSYRTSPVAVIGPVRTSAPLPAVPAFSVAIPTTEAVALPPAGERRPEYPQAARSVGASGTVSVQFVVDTSGRAIPGSIRLVEADGEQHAVFQHSFFEAARGAVIGARYRPAHVGPCPVRQVVQQVFVFAINDASLPGSH